MVDARQIASRLAGSYDNLRKLVGEEVKRAIIDELRADSRSSSGQARLAGAAIKDGSRPVEETDKARTQERY